MRQHRSQEIKRTSLPEKWKPAGRTANWKKQLFIDVASDSSLGPVLKRRLEEKSSVAARYLREQGLTDQTSSGLVDCGWSGTWTDIIGGLVETQGGMKPLVFFLGRRKRSEPGRCETIGWMFDHQSGSGLKAIPDYFHVVVEFLLTADHGRTIGFEEADGRLRPTLAAVDWQGFEPEGWRIFRRALLNFAESYAQQLQPDREAADLRSVLNELLVLFWEQPTVEEARLFAGHTIGLSPSRANTETLARAYGLNDVLRLAVFWKLPGHPPFWWHEGAQALSGSAIRMSMGLVWEVRQLVRALKSNGKRGMGAKHLTQLLLASARNLKHACAQREEHDGCRFESAEEQPEVERKAPDPLAATSSRPISIL